MAQVFTIDEDDRLVISTAIAAQTAFTYNFPLQNEADLTVIREDGATGVQTTLVNPTHYTVSGVGAEAGGTVTLNAGATAGDIYYLIGEASLERLQSVARNGRFQSDAMDADFDRMVLVAQEQRRDIGRAWKAGYGVSGGIIEVGAADTTAKFDADGNLAEGPTAGEIENAQHYAEVALDAATAAALSAANASGLTQVETRALLAAAAAANGVVWLSGQSGGLFQWSGSDHSADVTADPEQGLFVPPTGDATGATGAWMRKFDGAVVSSWFGTSEDASAAANFTAFNAAIAYTTATGQPLLVTHGTYDFSATLTFPGGNVVFWENVIMRKQFDGVGIHYAGGSDVIFHHGFLLVDKGAGGSGPAGDGEVAANTTAGVDDTDHGVKISNRLTNLGEIYGRNQQGDGVHLSATENMNSARFGLLRGQFNGRYGIGASGTGNDVSLITMKARVYGNWMCGLHLPDDFEARAWLEADISAEQNGQDVATTASPGVYLGKAYADSYFKIYSENAAPIDIEIGPNSQYISIMDLRVNTTTNNSLKPNTITFSQKTNLPGTTPQEGFSRAGSVTVGSTSRYISRKWYGASETLIMERRIYGSGAMHFIPQAGSAVQIAFLSSGDFELFGTNKAIYLKSPDGTRYRLGVANGGTVAITAVP